MKAEIRAYILTDLSVSSLIGSRLYWGIADQETTMPYATIQLIGEAEDYTHDGADGLITSYIQLDAWASTLASASAVIDAIRARINGITAITQGSVVFDFIKCAQRTTQYDEPTRTHGEQLDFQITYHNT